MTYRPTKKFTATIAGISALALVLTACSSSTTSSSSSTTAARPARRRPAQAAVRRRAAAATGSGAAAADGDFCTQIKSQCLGDLTGKTVGFYTGVSSPEDQPWQTSFKPFEECTGATIQYEGSKEFEAQIIVRVAAATRRTSRSSRSRVC